MHASSEVAYLRKHKCVSGLYLLPKIGLLTASNVIRFSCTRESKDRVVFRLFLLSKLHRLPPNLTRLPPSTYLSAWLIAKLIAQKRKKKGKTSLMDSGFFDSDTLSPRFVSLDLSMEKLISTASIVDPDRLNLWFEIWICPFHQLIGLFVNHDMDCRSGYVQSMDFYEVRLVIC